MNSLKEEMGGFVGSKVERVPCDLTHWTDVAAAASKISKATDKIRILINNGGRGIMTHQLTSYSIDEHIVVNHIGYVILNSHLLPILKKTSETNKVRIVILGSILHESAPTDTKFALLDEIKTDLGPYKQYARSKLAVMLYARYMATHLLRTHSNILINCVQLGIVETAQSKQHIHEAHPTDGFAMSVGLNSPKKHQFHRAVSAMFLATKTGKTGQYIRPPAMPEQGS